MNIRCHPLNPVGFSLGVFLTASTAFAEWPNQVDVDLLASAANIQASAPSVAADGNRGVFAAWNDRRNFTTNNEDVFAQYYNYNGVAQWGANGVAVCEAVNLQNDVIAVNAGNGSVYIVWSDERDSANNERIYAQLLDAQGDPQWAVNGIRVGPNNFDQTDLVAVSDGAGGLLVAWSEVSNDFRTFVQKINSDGDLLWGAGGFEFSSGVFGGASELNVISDGAGGAVLGWIQFGDNPRTVWMRRILANGTAAFAAVGFGNDFQALGNFIPMAPDGTGGAYLGWQVDNGVNDNLYIQRVDGTGNLPWGTDSVRVVDQPLVQDNMQLIADNGGGAYICWDDPRTNVDNVYIQHVTSTGSFSFAADGIPVGTTTGQRFTARMIPDGAGGAIVSFRYNQFGTYAQRISAGGVRLWGVDGVQMTDNGSVNFPNLTSDGNNGAILGVLAFTNGNRAALKRILENGELPDSRMLSLSTRGVSLTGDDLLIPGFSIAGSGTKRLLIRAIGPTLGVTPFDIPGVLPDPTITLNRWNGTSYDVVQSNDNWMTNANAADITTVSAQVFAFGLSSDLEAILLVDLAAGQYTVVTSGVGGTTGISIVELYDADTVSTSSLTSISNRGFIGVGDEVMIPGFAISNEGPKTFLIRVVGPRLAGDPFLVPGTMDDPQLTVFRRVGGIDTAIASNDNWGDDPGAANTEAVAAQVFAFALDAGSADAAIVLTLQPGVYTVVGSAADLVSTGVALVEVYEVP